MNYPCAKFPHHSILKYKEHKYFPIPRDFTQNLAILPWYGLIQSFVFIGRSYFHKNNQSTKVLRANGISFFFSQLDIED